MMMSSFTSLLLLCTLASFSSAFQGPLITSVQQKKSQAKPVLFLFPELLQLPKRTSTTTVIEVGWTMESSEDVRTLFQRARDCAYNEETGAEECSVEDASDLLQDLTFLLSNCQIGSPLGTDNAVCDNQDVAADVVARLRVKSASISPSGAAVAEMVEEQEESVWATMLWKVLTDLEIPTAIFFYFACIFCMIHFGEFGVNQIPVEEMNAQVNDYYMSSSGPPSAFFLYHPQPF